MHFDRTRTWHSHESPACTIIVVYISHGFLSTGQWSHGVPVGISVGSCVGLRLDGALVGLCVGPLVARGVGATVAWQLL
jgi:hypothetical protein